jgi:hypothetical protein
MAELEVGRLQPAQLDTVIVIGVEKGPIKKPDRQSPSLRVLLVEIADP